MIDDEEFNDIVVWDTSAILSCAKELVHNAFIARQAGNVRLCSSYATKALDTLADCENDFPNAVAALRGSLERL